jgi:base plate protein
MRPLTAAGLIRVWERGHGQRPFDRALTLLAAGLPDQSVQTMATLSVGQRDAGLLDLREQSLGGTLRAFADCPACGTGLSFVLKTGELKTSLDSDSPAENGTVSRNGISVTFRLPTSADFASLPSTADPSLIRTELAQRCVLNAQVDGRRIEAGDLPAELIDDMSEAMAKQDPQAEIRIHLSCPTCAHHWSDFFDIASFFWSEISVMARRLLSEVDALARRYGWREADILAMSHWRRHAYLQLGDQ